LLLLFRCRWLCLLVLCFVCCCLMMLMMLFVVQMLLIVKNIADVVELNWATTSATTKTKQNNKHWNTATEHTTEQKQQQRTCLPPRGNRRRGNLLQLSLLHSPGAGWSQVHRDQFFPFVGSPHVSPHVAVQHPRFRGDFTPVGPIWLVPSYRTANRTLSDRPEILIGWKISVFPRIWGECCVWRKIAAPDWLAGSGGRFPLVERARRFVAVGRSIKQEARGPTITKRIQIPRFSSCHQRFSDSDGPPVKKLCSKLALRSVWVGKPLVAGRKTGNLNAFCNTAKAVGNKSSTRQSISFFLSFSWLGPHKTLGIPCFFRIESTIRTRAEFAAQTSGAHRKKAFLHLLLSQVSCCCVCWSRMLFF